MPDYKEVMLLKGPAENGIQVSDSVIKIKICLKRTNNKVS